MSQSTVIDWSAHSHSGTRKERNDDSWLAFSSSPKGAQALDASGSHPLASHDLVFAVSDGMGGGNAGDLASSLIVRKMSEMIPETFKIAASGFFPDCIDHLNEALKSVHQHINDQGHGENKGMAATLALTWFTPENLYMANVGDSRIYLCRNGELTQLSRDHTMAWLQWHRGEISEVEYRNHPRRAALYEVVGGSRQHINPHCKVVPYQTDDRFLICSDGLIDGVWERHIKNALNSGETPETVCQGLLKRSLENSGIDDTTLIVIHVRDESGLD